VKAACKGGLSSFWVKAAWGESCTPVKSSLRRKRMVRKMRERNRDLTVRKLLKSVTEKAVESAFVMKCRFWTGTEIGHWIYVPEILKQRAWREAKSLYTEETQWDDPITVATGMIAAGIITEVAHNTVNQAKWEILHMIAEEAIKAIEKNHGMTSRLRQLAKSCVRHVDWSLPSGTDQQRVRSLSR